MKKILIRILPLAIITASLLASILIITDAKADSPALKDVKFPVAELGNCNNAQECKKYCDNEQNITACVTFGQSHGLISAEDAARAKEFADVLKGEGPGQCKSKEECETYCADITRSDECLTFVEKHNLIPSGQLAEIRKISKVLKAGARLPGGCKDKNSCDNYCSDPSHADECLSFAEQAGLIPAEELAQAKKVLPLIKRGESPGQCKSKSECESYCKDDSHISECVNFAEKAGFMTKEEADMVRKTGGKGPGGCNSKESCDTYCNKQENQEACFAFAEQHGLIPEEKLKEMKEGMGRLRAGINQMPQQVIICLKSKLGENIVGKIESGQFTPGPRTGEVIKECVEAAMPQIRERINSALRMATPAVIQCLENGLGKDGVGKIKAGEAPTPEMGDVMKRCFESMRQEGLGKFKEGLKQMPPEMRQCVMEKLGVGTIAKIESGTDVELGLETQTAIQDCAASAGNVMMQKMEEGLSQAPPEIRDCIKGEIGDIADKIKSGAIRGQEDIRGNIDNCVKKIKPQGIPSDMELPVGVPSPEEMQNYKPSGIPKTDDYKPANAPTPAQPPADFAPTSDICVKFNMAPSCDYVPEPTRDLCKKCKGQ